MCYSTYLFDLGCCRGLAGPREGTNSTPSIQEWVLACSAGAWNRGWIVEQNLLHPSDVEKLYSSVHGKQFGPIIRCMCCKNCDSAPLCEDHISTVASFEIRLAQRQFWGFVWQQQKGRINIQETQEEGNFYHFAENETCSVEETSFSGGKEWRVPPAKPHSSNQHLLNANTELPVQKIKTEAVTNQDFTQYYKKLQYEDCTVLVL